LKRPSEKNEAGGEEEDAKKSTTVGKISFLQKVLSDTRQSKILIQPGGLFFTL